GLPRRDVLSSRGLARNPGKRSSPPVSLPPCRTCRRAVRRAAARGNPEPTVRALARVAAVLCLRRCFDRGSGGREGANRQRCCTRPVATRRVSRATQQENDASGLAAAGPLCHVQEGAPP